MEIKYCDWKDIDLSLWKTGSNFGPINPVTGKRLFRSDLSSTPPLAALIPSTGFVRQTIDYTNPGCPFRIEWTEEDWPIRFPIGTQDKYSFIIRFPETYNKKQVVTPKSVFQIFCRSTLVSKVMFQLELSGGDNLKYPQGSIQIIHASAAVPVRFATDIIPEPGQDVEVLIDLTHGLQGQIGCKLNGKSYYEKAAPTCFAVDPSATAQWKAGIYDHMVNNDFTKNPDGTLNSKAGVGDYNRKRHLDAGVKAFSLEYSPMTIIRRLPGDPAFGTWINNLIDPKRLNLNYQELLVQENQNDFLKRTIEETMTSLNSAKDEIIKMTALAKEQNETIASQGYTIEQKERAIDALNVQLTSAIDGKAKAEMFLQTIQDLAAQITAARQ